MAEAARYEGRVLSVDGDTFTAELIDCEDHSVVHADIPTSVMGNTAVEPGDILDVVGAIEGRPATITLRDLGRWTEAELQAVRERAEQRAAEFAAILA